MSRGGEPDSVHGWLLLDTYLRIHTRRMQDFQNEGFLQVDGVEFRDRGVDKIDVKGRIRCRGVGSST